MIDNIKRSLDIYKEYGGAVLANRILVHLSDQLPSPDSKMKDIQGIIDDESPIVIDGGANRGQTIQLFHEYFSSPKIHAFEPIPELVTKLKDSYESDRIQVYQSALGQENMKTTFNVASTSDQSSILSFSNFVDRPSRRISDSEINQIEVQVVRLDEIINETNIDILKLDLQGYELMALKGATGILDDVSLVLTEVQFVPLYEGAALFYDIHDFLDTHGFGLYNLYNLTSGQTGRLEHGDAIYIDRSEFPEFEWWQE